MEAKHNKGRTAGMKRLIIVCEGPTEQEFCNNVLMPEFIKHDIIVETPVIKRSQGGIVHWDVLKKQLINHLYENEVFVSMLIDYYGIKPQFNFPGWQESINIKNKEERLYYLLEKIREDIPENLRHRFIPYIQLHEFEGLLFSDINVFQENFTVDEVDMNVLQKAVEKYDNPEQINDSPRTAPSKRLENAINGYSKVLYGNFLAMEIGLEKIRNKCPLFNEWINKLLAI